MRTLVPQEVIHMLRLYRSPGKAIPLETISPGNASQEPDKIFHLLKLIFSCSPSGCSTLAFWLTFICYFCSIAVPHVVTTATTHARTRSSRCHKPEAPKVSVSPCTPPAQPFSHTCEISFQRHQPTHPQVYKKHPMCKLSQAGLSKPGCQQQCWRTVVYKSLESARIQLDLKQETEQRVKAKRVFPVVI